MRVAALHLASFRNYTELSLTLDDGITVFEGDNGHGKTNLIEAVAFLATLKSFRGSPASAMVKNGAESAVIRADVVNNDRTLLFEVEIPRSQRIRAQINRQRVSSGRDMAQEMSVTVFSPDDLELVKGSPAIRRALLDDLLAQLHPKNAAALSDFERTLKQRNALLKQLRGRLGEEDAITLDVWDDRLVATGERIAGLRTRLCDQLGPLVGEAYADLDGGTSVVSVSYVGDWHAVGLADALRESRGDDVRRGLSLVGPHRDEVEIGLAGLPARTSASQGEQRSLVLALRLASHRLVIAARDHTPILLLDDVFSELDPRRCAALVAHLPAGQTILTTAHPLPAELGHDARFVVRDGVVTAG